MSLTTEQVRDAQLKAEGKSLAIDRLEQVVAAINQLGILINVGNRASPFLFSQYDRLFINSWNSVSTLTGIRIFARILLPNGEVVLFRGLTHTPNTDRSRATAFFRLPQDSYLLNLVVGVIGAPGQVGQTWLQVGITIRGESGGDIGAVLIHSYLVSGIEASWPNVRTDKYSVEGPGMLRSISGTDPAAGVDISEAAPTNARWKFLGARMTLVTDATSINREVKAELTDGTTAYWRSSAVFNQTASTTVSHNFGPANGTGSSGEILYALPVSVPLRQAFTWGTSTNNLQAGDNWGAPHFLVMEWIEE